jgi:maleylacetoacetate isomerase
VNNSPLNIPKSIAVYQSISILEFLEEFPSFSGCPKLLPRDPIARAKVRDLVNIIASDTQPPSNQHVLKRVAAMDGGDSKKWAAELMTRGLRAFEGLLKKHGAGVYSVGDEITLADLRNFLGSKVCMIISVS